MSSDLELTVKKVIPAARKDIFEAWLDAKALAQFILPAEGMPNPKVENDPKVGGSFLIIMNVGDQELPHKGEYKTIKEYDEIAFTWESAYSIPNSLVTLNFKELGPKETEVTLHHKGFPHEESRDNHQDGWGRILEALNQTLA